MSTTDHPAPQTTDGRFTVLDNTEAGQFELLLDGELVGFATYHQEGSVVVVPHVETLAEHRGQGYGDQLMAGLLTLLEQSGRTIRPLCWFAAGHLRARPDRQHLLA